MAKLAVYKLQWDEIDKLGNHNGTLSGTLAYRKIIDWGGFSNNNTGRIDIWSIYSNGATSMSVSYWYITNGNDSYLVSSATTGLYGGHSYNSWWYYLRAQIKSSGYKAVCMDTSITWGWGSAWYSVDYYVYTRNTDGTAKLYKNWQLKVTGTTDLTGAVDISQPLALAWYYGNTLFYGELACVVCDSSTLTATQIKNQYLFHKWFM